MDIYNQIFEFCKVRNKGSVFSNSDNELSPRLKFITELLENEKIDYEVDKFISDKVPCYNIIMKGTSKRMVIAHHDVANPNIDNANDNSASVINAIALKKLTPELNVVLVDGEEVGGLGSEHLAKQINNNKFGDIEWVLNLELTGKGGRYFFIGNHPGNLQNHIKKLFDPPIKSTPFNDSVILNKYGIDSLVINPLPILAEGKTSCVKHNGKYLDYDTLWYCHNEKDSIDKISTKDMKIFTEEILLKIVKS